MQSRTTKRFWRLFSDLPLDVQGDAKRAYRIFQENRGHPGLQFKKLEGNDDIYLARIGLAYRALAVSRKIVSSGSGLVVTTITTAWFEHGQS